VFTLRLPRAPADPDPGRTRTAGAARSGGLRILAVDDNLDLVTGISRLLSLAGHDVRTVADGVSALAEARRFQPDIILLDIGLPDMDGYEVATQLRQDAAFATTTLVALSGYGQEEDRRRSSQAGFDHHLVKPVESHELTGLLRTLWTSRHRPERPSREPHPPEACAG
jgi:CheY-like chemotaxis protein